MIRNCNQDHSSALHYDKTPMQYAAIFHGCKNDIFQLNLFDYFHTFERVPTIYVLEQKYETMYTPVNSVFHIKHTVMLS